MVATALQVATLLWRNHRHTHIPTTHTHIHTHTTNTGMVAMALQVVTLMWLRTTINYQYRFGTSTMVALRTLYADGGIPRFYQGMAPALIQVRHCVCMCVCVRLCFCLWSCGSSDHRVICYPLIPFQVISQPTIPHFFFASTHIHTCTHRHTNSHPCFPSLSLSLSLSLSHSFSLSLSLTHSFSLSLSLSLSLTHTHTHTNTHTHVTHSGSPVTIW